MANSEVLTHAQTIDPGMMLALELSGQQQDVVELKGRKNNFGRGISMLAVAGTFGVLGGTASEIADDSSEAYAEGCFASDGKDGMVWYDPCPGSEPTPTSPPAPTPTAPAPTPTSPPSSGGSSGSGSSSGGSSGGSQPAVTSPPKPTYEQILAYVGCEDDKGNPALAKQLDTLKGVDGSGRLVTLVDWCELDYIEEAGIKEGYGRPNTNWEDLIANPDLNVTPNVAQTDAINVFLLENWNSLNTPATTSTVAETTTSTSTSTSTTSTTSSTSTTNVPVSTEAENIIDTTEAPQITELEAENATETTEVEIVVISESDSDSENGINWLIPAGVAGSAAVLGAIIFARKRKEDETSATSSTTPVAGS